MDWELLKVLLTTTGPMGLLAYGMFLHYSKVTQSNADARTADAKQYAERLLEMTTDRRSERDILVSVVRENSAAITALTTTIQTDLGFIRRSGDNKQ